MNKNLITTFFFFSLAVSLFSLSSNAQTKCVNYTTQGVTQCVVEEKEKKEVLEKENIDVPDASNTVVIIKYVREEKPEEELSDEEKMERKVQRHMDDHGKPPREFVRFNLEPTVENAIKWELRREELSKRAFEITKAMAQAKEIIKQKRESGEELPKLKEPLPEIQDYGQELPEETAKFLGSPSQQEAEDVSLAAYRAAGGLSTEVSRVRGGRIGGVAESRGPLQVSYYFSSECPYCKRFEPVFQKTILELKGKVFTTCVDMSPAGKQAPENVIGKVDCIWRPIAANEALELRIKSTPTLIMNSGVKGEKPVRLEGLVEESKLRRTFLNILR